MKLGIQVFVLLLKGFTGELLLCQQIGKDVSLFGDSFDHLSYLEGFTDCHFEFFVVVSELSLHLFKIVDLLFQTVDFVVALLLKMDQLGFFHLVDSSLPGKQPKELHFPEIFQEDMGTKLLLSILLIGQHLMQFHFLQDLFLKRDLFAVLHLHLVLLPVENLNQIFSFHGLEHFIEILRGFVPYPEGIIELRFS